VERRTQTLARLDALYGKSPHADPVYRSGAGGCRSHVGNSGRKDSGEVEMDARDAAMSEGLGPRANGPAIGC
jgi:hypothetical protein